MARLSFALVLLATVAGVSPGLAQDAPSKEAQSKDAAPKPASAPSVATTPVTPAKVARQPYLSDTAAPDLVAILPAPPRGQSAAETADKAAFTATRSLKGSPRWDLATTDVADGASAILDDFACVIGQRIDQARAPALMTLLERSRLDIARATRAPKEHYRRIRPFVGNDAEICVVRSAEIANAFSFPSSHATQGWTYASIMAALIPEKATQFFLRARSYGESRVVCGLHWMSDIQAGRTTGSVVFAALQGDAGFRTDLERARTEVAKLVASGGAAPDQAICKREAAGYDSIL
ncbi:acid phosphatase [Methylobacterium sp. J-090]|uniref:acid phosphatase n=1 Tax=Methylobacterium sp. J-090 TaxID=2836666 RepID=UPI001FBBAD16|nr:phosphatase PAP2 family protein [Methylobacterium sp. J-090]MCJ2084351.1 phosphatase PAP2 family protein [Methylobacterium sp. J-090]